MSLDEYTSTRIRGQAFIDRSYKFVENSQDIIDGLLENIKHAHEMIQMTDDPVVIEKTKTAIAFYTDSIVKVRTNMEKTQEWIDEVEKDVLDLAEEARERRENGLLVIILILIFYGVIYYY